MRISDSSIFDNARRQAAAAREAASSAQEVLSAGTRIQHPGDDPAGAGLIVAFSMSSERLLAISKSTAAASDELAAADGALDSVSNSLARARELAVQFSNAGYSASQLAMGADEVKSLIAQVIAGLNTRFGNRYIFGGTKDDQPPFTDTGLYQGDPNVRQVDIAPGVKQDASVRADTAFKGVGGGVDVLGTLQRLQQALEAGNASAVQAALNDLDTSVTQASTARSQVGVYMNVLDTASSANKIASGEDDTRAKKQGEVDLAQASIELASTQTALQATYSAVAQSFKLSLLNFIG